jgi:hypothetical protein
VRCPACLVETEPTDALCPRCGTAVRGNVAPADPGSEAELDPPNTQLQAAVGAGYTVETCIGSGGFGVVYAATDVRLGRAVAIKALRREWFESEEMRQRFEHEARVVASLRHPNIVPIFHVGEGDDIAFMVMPRINGVSLRAELDRMGQLPVDEVARIGSEIADALDAAHRQGILHRDVKPENIMLEGPERRALLMDFGISRSPARTPSDATGTGVVIGSPRYLSPEQARALPDLDARSDLYSLGLVCYELLAGRRPFDSRSVPDLIYKQATSRPTDLVQLRPDSAGELADAIMTCLEVEPSRRPSSAAEFGARLRTLARARSDTIAERFADRSWLDRRLLPIAIVGFSFYVTVFMLPLFDMLAARGEANLFGPVMRLVGWAWVVGIPVLLVDLLAARWALVRAGAMARARLLFGQPRWWGTWYPRALRSRASAWSVMTIQARVANAAAWAVVGASVGMLPWLLVGRPSMQNFAALGLVLPLATRQLILLSELLATVQRTGLAVVLGALLLWRLRYGITLSDGVRAIADARRPAWQDSSARVLLRPD